MSATHFIDVPLSKGLFLYTLLIISDLSGMFSTQLRFLQNAPLMSIVDNNVFNTKHFFAILSVIRYLKYYLFFSIYGGIVLENRSYSFRVMACPGRKSLKCGNKNNGSVTRMLKLDLYNWIHPLLIYVFAPVLFSTVTWWNVISGTRHVSQGSMTFSTGK